MLSVDRFSENFTPHPIPQVLKDLLEFQNDSNQWDREGFEHSRVTQKDALKYHVKEEALSQFLGFGHEAEGSLYALWLYQGNSLEDAPVV